MQRPRLRFLAAAVMTAGFSSQLHLEPPPGLSEDAIKAELAGDVIPASDARLDRAFLFEAAEIDVQRPTLASASLNWWFRRDLRRGWEAVGGLGPARPDGTRSAWFSRRHAEMGIDWPVYGVARPAPCRDSSALACYEVTSADPEVRVEFGGRHRYVRVRPYAHFSVHEDGGELRGEARVLGMVRQGDAAQLSTIDNNGRWGHAFGFLEQVVMRPDVDHDGDGVGDHWRVTAVSTGRVTLAR